MEASSQAMDFHRCDALEYSVAVFTNLTRDHLDYHKTMENYWFAKRRLFDGFSVVNAATRQYVILHAELIAVREHNLVVFDYDSPCCFTHATSIAYD